MRTVILVMVLALVGVGCSTTTPIGASHRYYFQHALLNFETQPLYPRYFRVPEPLVEEPTEEEGFVLAKTDRQHKASKKAYRPAGEDPVPLGRRGLAPAVEHPSESEDEPSEEVDAESAGDLAALIGKKPPGGGNSPEYREAGVSLVRREVIESSRRLIGIKDDFTPERFLKHVLRVNELEYVSFKGKEFNRTLYRELRNRGMTYDSATPQPGDIVFFHNTWDRNNDGRNNDWYTGTGIVVAVEKETVVFVGVANGEVRELRLNLEQPDVRRMEDEQATLNSFLRSKTLSDPEYTQYLAGELFAGYASVVQP